MRNVSAHTGVVPAAGVLSPPRPTSRVLAFGSEEVRILGKRP